MKRINSDLIDIAAALGLTVQNVDTDKLKLEILEGIDALQYRDQCRQSMVKKAGRKASRWRSIANNCIRADR